ncbi:MAG: hypothetical protein Q7S40_17490 [Opitutaceae bacterium]|nr:hypothetical protein [Opitutaceae bacterium]
MNVPFFSRRRKAVVLALLAAAFAALAQAAPPSHPFILFQPSELPAVRAKVQKGWIKAAFARMKGQADAFMDVPTNPYPLEGPAGGRATAGRVLNVRLNTLALTGYILEDARYLDKAVQILEAAVTQLGVDDFYKFNEHLAVADAAHAYAVAYDWLFPHLTPGQRQLVQNEVEQFGQWLYHDSNNGGGFGRYDPVPLSCNHNAVHHGALGLCALVLGDKPEWLSWAQKYTLGYYEYARDATGYNYEGIGYYGYGELGATTFSAAFKKAGGPDLLAKVEKNRYVSEYVLRQLQPWGGSVIALNDSPDRLHAASGLMYKAVATQDRVALWTWLKLLGAEGDKTYGMPDPYLGGGCSGPYTILFADPNLQPLSPQDAKLPLGMFFARGTGTFRSSWNDDAAMAVFTCGFDQHRGHNHKDENSFAFSAFGESFAIDPPGQLWETRSHNAILIDSTGQGRQIGGYDNFGVMLDQKELPHGWYMKGDARDVYRHATELEKASRQFLFIPAETPYIVLADDIQKAHGDGEYSWLLHTELAHEIRFDAPQRFTIVGRSGAACRVQLLHPTEGLAIAEVDQTGQNIKIRGREYRYSRHSRLLATKWTGRNPRFVAILAAAPQAAALPEVTQAVDADTVTLTIVMPHGVTDTVTVTRDRLTHSRITK